MPTEKGDQILAGAMQEFVTHGYAATSMDRVAKTAGVSKATVYSHFGDKEGLFSALVSRVVQQRFPEILRSPDVPELQGETVSGLRLIAEKILQGKNDPEYINFSRMVIGEASRFPELAQILVKNLVKPGIELISHYLMSRPDLHIPDPEATARILLGSIIHFVIVQEMLHGKEIMPMDSDRLIDSLVYLILHCDRPATPSPQMKAPS